ncbi:MAG: 3-deoxy-manno-octulosonate cytidylyltransferase [Bacteroidetes bacterium HGW-Bacteroidetes-22]|nr:MAG: 3-deoxy-manno-octulosonate cytidylyltransferase [Bacteroidetes bacterium HGW-Bacteroidetes-22]
MNCIGIIPARYASSRFPGKPLVMIQGVSMVMRVYQQVLKAASLNHVVVATDDKAILLHVEKQGGHAVMTSELHRSGTERCYEAAMIMAGELHIDVVVNVQGDEPYIDPQQIEKVLSSFSDPSVEIATLAKKISDQTELFNPNAVKVAIGEDGRAIYFSRHPIPYVRGCGQDEWIKKQTFYKHIGLYAYRLDTLKRIVALPPDALEEAESLEQLRWLANGIPVHVELTETESQAVDTPEDLLKLINNA